LGEGGTIFSTKKQTKGHGKNLKKKNIKTTGNGYEGLKIGKGKEL